jgi:HEAT repeat protein
VRRSAVLALGRLGTSIALTYVASAARDASWEVRVAVIETLSPDAGSVMKATLEQLCLDENASVAKRARSRLEEIEGD